MTGTASVGSDKKEKKRSLEYRTSDPLLSIVGNLVSFIGGVLLIVGIFMPWASAGEFVFSSAFRVTSKAVLLLVIAIVGVIFCLLGFILKRNFTLFVTLCGFGSIGVLFYLYGIVASAKIGIGFFLCAAGAVVILIGTSIMPPKLDTPTPPTKENEPD